MKVFAFILIVVAFFSFCLKTPNHSESNSEAETLTLSNSPPILEIQQDAVGMWTVTGKSLSFRLYENGIAEFEYADDTKKTKEPTQKFEDISTLKRVKLNKEELQKFIALLDSESLQNIQKTYKRKCCCTDATLTYKVNFKSNNQEEITLSGYCESNEITNAKAHNIVDIPQVISDLFNSVITIKLKHDPH